jgi:hypothetical protein
MVSVSSGGVICFTPGTMIDTPDGPRLVEDLCEGDKLQTRDSGAQDIQWIGSRRMTGARLFAMPELRPIRIRAGAFELEKPDQEFLVSPNHLMLPKHEIVLANGVETESFHPASTALSTIPEADRARLAEVNSEIEADPNSYGGYARRILSQSEAAILAHQAA